MSWFLYLLVIWAIGLISWWSLRTWHRARLIAYHYGSAAEQAELEAFYDAYYAREASPTTGGCELAWQEEFERMTAERARREYATVQMQRFVEENEHEAAWRRQLDADFANFIA